MKKTKKKSPSSVHTEIPGIGLLFITMFWSLALLSYVDGSPTSNVLGYLGYYSAFISLYCFGLSSYLCLGALFYSGICLINQEYFVSKKALFSWSVLVISTSFLATILADSYPSKAPLFGGRVYAERISNKEDLVRHNLGGVPFYYLYKDIPIMNLKELLSPSGTCLVAMTFFLVSLLLLTKTSLQEVFSFLLQLIGRFFFARRPKALAKERKKIRTSPKKEPRILSSEKAPPKAGILRKALRLHKPSSLLQKRKSVPSVLSYPYKIPSSSLLTDPKPVDKSLLAKDLQEQATVLENTLKNFHIDARVGDIHSGPTITSFEVEPPVGVKVQKIKALENDIALSMQAKSIRIVAPIPGKAVVGIEVPSSIPQEVSFKEMIDHYQAGSKNYAIPIMVGKTVLGEYVSEDLAKMPHLLIAGATGSGKSVFINTLVMSIVMNARPDEIKLLMIDPKKVELTQYSTLPHMIAPVISEPHGAYAALQWIVKEMQFRYEMLKQTKMRNIQAFNSRHPQLEKEKSLPIAIPKHMPFIVVIIDEFADLMMVSSSDLETPIARIAQMARAVGIHLVLATQRPSRKVTTGIIKVNFPVRIAFKVPNRVNSQIILDETGAESLLGYGDLLFKGASSLVRAQGAYIPDSDINTIMEEITKQAPTNYLIESFDAMKKGENDRINSEDALYEKALEIVLASKSASTTFLQRKLKIGYARAASLMDELEKNGVVGPQEGAKPRKVMKQSSFLSS